MEEVLEEAITFAIGDDTCEGILAYRESGQPRTALLILALSWLGLWLWLPPLGRAAGVFAFFVLAVAATVPLFFVRVPSSFEGLRRLDSKSNLPHRPATAIADEIAPEAKDQFALALWRAHVERALLAAKSAVIAFLPSQPNSAEITAVADQTHAAELMIYVIDHSRSLPEIPVI